MVFKQLHAARTQRDGEHARAGERGGGYAALAISTAGLHHRRKEENSESHSHLSPSTIHSAARHEIGWLGGKDRRLAFVPVRGAI